MLQGNSVHASVVARVWAINLLGYLPAEVPITHSLGNCLKTKAVELISSSYLFIIQIIYYIISSFLLFFHPIPKKKKNTGT